MTVPAELADLVAWQMGVAIGQQLLDGGVTIGQLRWAPGRRWRMVLPRVALSSPACRPWTSAWWRRCCSPVPTRGSRG